MFSEAQGTQEIFVIDPTVGTDKSVIGTVPGSPCMPVTPQTPFSSITQWVTDQSGQFSGNVTLCILTHGVTGDETETTGGFGFNLGNLWVTTQTVGQLSALANKAKGVVLPACRVAYISPSRQGPNNTTISGDGNALCSAMAQDMQCCLWASTAVQYFTTTQLMCKGGADIHFWGWQGTVLKYSSAGVVVDSRNYPVTGPPNNTLSYWRSVLGG